MILVAWLAIAGINLASDTVLDLLQLLGGLYLVYYSYLLVVPQKHEASAGSQENTESIADRSGVDISGINILSKGFFVGISNPKDIIFFASFFPPFMKKLGAGPNKSALLLTIVWCVLDYLILAAYGVLAGRLVPRKHERKVTLCCALSFLALGVYSVVNAWPLDLTF